jgi:hypothetical protein
MNVVRLVLLCFVILCIFVCGLFVGRLFRKPAPVVPPPQIANTATVLKEVQGLSQLVTVKYVLEKVVVLEDAKWYGENRLLMVAHGIAKAGVDLKELKPEDIRIVGTTLRINLPKSFITDAYLDDKRTRVIEQTTGVLRAFDKDLQQNARQQAVAAITKAAREIGIEREAEERAREQLRGLFRQLGFTEVEFGTK